MAKLFLLGCLVYQLGIAPVSAKPAEGIQTLESHALLLKDDSAILQVGEELTYNISYLIDIGQVRVKITDKVQKDHHTYYNAIVYIDSYKGIPFGGIHYIFETMMDPGFFSAWFHSVDRDDRSGGYTQYDFDYSKKIVFIEHGYKDTTRQKFRQSIAIDTFCQDGLSLFYYARSLVNTKQQITTPSVVGDKKVSTYFNFLNERSGETIDAVDYPVDVIHFDGKANFVGIYGLTGEFEGWFSNDPVRIPIRAKMNVIIGSIKIELMKWNRPGWNPPRFSD